MKLKKSLLKLSITRKASDQERLFDEIYWSKADKIKKQAFFLLGQNHYEDAVQEVFIKIYRGLSDFDGKSHLDTWIYRITLNTCIDFLRKTSRHSDQTDISKTNLRAEEIEGVDPVKRRAILEGIEKLNEKQKSVFVLFFIMELKISEISEILEINEGTVKSRIFNAKNEMQIFLKNKGVYDG
jgi:RNA polymerase sigma-70 factor (ECF subfamily)